MLELIFDIGMQKDISLREVCALFQSVSEKYPGLVEKHRELLIVSFIYDKEIFKNVYFDFRILPYKDFIEKIIEWNRT